ncbi:MAG: helix-turn-helix domain-containing protein [Bacillota bacterium]|nr:helix-turn-helix domain-containing protein [Bacillota bacterium]
MYDFRDFLQELNSSIDIKFSITTEEGTTMFANNSDIESSERVYIPIFLGKSKAFISIDKKFEYSASLLKYIIENKYKEMYSIKEQTLIDILEGKEVSYDKVENNLPILSKGCTLFLLNVDGNKYEALNVIKQLYNDQDIMSVIYQDDIIVLGVFQEVSEHAASMREAVISDLYCNCFISYGNIAYDKDTLKRAFDNAKQCIMLGKKFGIKDDVLDYNKLLFEKIVYSISPKLKQELLEDFKEKFNNFDSEMILTIEEFVRSGLNISEASRKLYIHRNTLIYRVDKIKKETGFDIRNFKEATVFTIAFLVWREAK